MKGEIFIFKYYIIKYCSPVLDGIKTASLFNYPIDGSIKELSKILLEYNSEINKFGIFIENLKFKNKLALIYVYRKDKLNKELSSFETRKFLSTFGYNNYNVSQALSFLKKRICLNECFPHEIGIFLGYPLDDVKGFIKNKGMNYKLCGYWKVYCNEENAKKCFEQYNKCTHKYIKLNHKSLSEIMV